MENVGAAQGIFSAPKVSVCDCGSTLSACENHNTVFIQRSCDCV